MKRVVDMAKAFSRKWTRPDTGFGLFFVTSFFSVGCASLPDHERTVLVEASRNYSKGETSAAVSSLDRLIRDYENTSEIAEAHYLRGLCRLKLEQRQAASEDFERGLSKSNRDDLTARCRASLAAIAYQDGRWTQAAEMYGKAAPALPDVPPTDVVLLAAGISMQRAGEWQQANLQFARVLQKFRSRPSAADARRLAGWRHSYFSIQLGAYRDADNAGKAVHSMRQQGLDAVQEYLPREEQPLWIVMAGRYANYADARNALLQIRQRYPQATIIP